MAMAMRQSPSEPQERPVILKLRFFEDARPSLLSISSILYDISLAHALAVLLTHEEYFDFKFTRFFWFRGGRHLLPKHEAKAVRIEKHSPLLVEVAMGIGAAWALIQIFDKVESWPRTRRKAKLELEKLEYEVNALRERHMQEEMARRGAEAIEAQLVRRLDHNEVKLIDLEILDDRPEPQRPGNDF